MDDDKNTKRENETDLEKDKLLRMAADLSNANKRLAKEKDRAGREGEIKAARGFMPLVDAIRRARKALSRCGDSAVTEGIEHLESSASNVIEGMNCRIVNPRGDKFDPNSHYAEQSRDDGRYGAGTIIEVTGLGLECDERIVEPPRVVVATGRKRSGKRRNRKGN